jgi:hypothetical protein
MGLRVLCMLFKCSTTELHPQPLPPLPISLSSITLALALCMLTSQCLNDYDFCSMTECLAELGLLLNCPFGFLSKLGTLFFPLKF